MIFFFFFFFFFGLVDAGVAFSSAVHGGVQYTALLAIQKCGCLHSTTGYGHFSLQTPLYKVNISPYAFHQRGVPLTPWGHSPTSLLSIV